MFFLLNSNLSMIKHNLDYLHQCVIEVGKHTVLVCPHFKTSRNLLFLLFNCQAKSGISIPC